MRVTERLVRAQEQVNEKVNEQMRACVLGWLSALSQRKRVEVSVRGAFGLSCLLLPCLPRAIPPQ